MSDITSRLRKRMEFDERVGATDDDFYGGRVYQHALTAPIFEAILKCVEALEYYASKDTWDREGVAAHITKDPKDPLGEYRDYWVDYGSDARQALAALEGKLK